MSNRSLSKSVEDPDRLFENLVSLEAIQDHLEKWMGHRYKRSTIYDWVHREKMPHVKVRGRLRFPVLEVAHWLKGKS